MKECPTIKNTQVSQCTYRCVVLPDMTHFDEEAALDLSQCTYRCVVLPDAV